MALALTIKKVAKYLRDKELILAAVASGNYVPGGDTVNLTNILNPNFVEGANVGFPGVIEDFSVEQMPAGYGGELIPGATLATWKLKITTTAGTELAAGAYPGAITGDTIYLRFKGPKLRF